MLINGQHILKSTSMAGIHLNNFQDMLGQINFCRIFLFGHKFAFFDHFSLFQNLYLITNRKQLLTDNNTKK